MRIQLYQVDAFSSKVFSGNPAGVCFLDNWIEDEVLQSIAAENNLSETAFLVRNGENLEIRWFTPVTEVSLCGHATLASAFVIFNYRRWEEDTVRFLTRRSGELVVKKQKDLLEMDFPSRKVHPQNPPPGLLEALKVTPQEVHSAAEVLMVVMDSEKAVREIQPDFAALNEIECDGVIVTAKGDQSDFVSRFFAPQLGIPEDPVTGSAHCILIPYWSGILHKSSLHAYQVSKRGGELFCKYKQDRVAISGTASLYLEGWITI